MRSIEPGISGWAACVVRSVESFDIIAAIILHECALAIGQVSERVILLVIAIQKILPPSRWHVERHQFGNLHRRTRAFFLPNDLKQIVFLIIGKGRQECS
jgi:hypothetical protein